MPNYCSYTMCAVSKDKKKLERLLKIMNYKDNVYYIYRCFGADSETDITTTDNYTGNEPLYKVKIFGDVAWSCYKWFETEENKQDKVVLRYDGANIIYGNAHYITLDILCKKLGIGIELFSEEPGCCFQEHYHVNHKGEILTSDCVEWHEIWCDNDGNELDEPYTEGGFEYYCDFMNASEIYG